MELFNPSDFATVQTVSNRIWKVADVLRNQTAINNYNVVPYLLSLLVEGKLDVFGETHIPMATGKGVVEHLKTVNSGSDLDILKEYEHQLRAIPADAWTGILKILFSIDREFVTENYSEVFEEVLKIFSRELARRHVEPILPKEITELMVSLAEASPRAKVFNPFAGLASFAKELPNEVSYFGQEINRAVWALGALRLKAMKRFSRARYVHEDSLANWPSSEGHYDLLISGLPFDVKLDGLFTLKQNFKNLESLVLSRGQDVLNEGGKMLLLLPQRFLFSSTKDDQDLRKRIIEKGYLRKVISFPAGTLYGTAVKFSVLELVFEESQDKSIVMMDADQFAKQESRGKRVKIDVFGILDALKNEEHPSVERVSKEELKESEYVLEPSRYFIKQVDGELLREICHFVKPTKAKPKESLPYVTIADLKDSPYDQNLQTDTLSIREPKVGYEKIDQSCILVAMRSAKLKPTYFEFKGQPIAVLRGSVAAMQIIDEAQVSKEFLLNELRATYVEDQAKKLLKGATIPYLTKKDLEAIRVKIPSLKEQKAKVAGAYEIANEIRLLEDRRNQLMHDSAEVSYQKFSSLKHALGTPLMNLGQGLKNIEAALDRNVEVWREVKISEVRDISLNDTFVSMRNILRDVHNLLSRNDQFLDMARYPLEDFDFLEFIKSYCHAQQASLAKNISLQLESSALIKAEFKNKLMVKGNTQLLRVAFDDMVSNALKHAFVSEEVAEQKISFYVDLSANRNKYDGAEGALNIRLEVRNTGKSFPENFDLDKFKRAGGKAGKTANTGQGGYQIDEIIKYHNEGNSTLELDTECEGSEYSTSVSFTLPLLK
jgi:type I restriction enzyme M protein